MITRKDVKHIAKLARLSLTSTEVEKFRGELSSILDYMEKLKKIDVKKVEPTTHPRLLESIMRKDEVKPQSIEMVDSLIKAAPKRRGRHIEVKAVF